MNKLYSCICLIAILILASCSTVQRKPESQAGIKARLFLEQGRREELKQNFSDALNLFKDAKHNAIVSNEFDLQLISLQGEARIEYINEDSLGYQTTINYMRKLVQDVSPGYKYRIIQIEFWKAFQTHDYNTILESKIDIAKLPLNVRIELLSYIIQTKAKLILSCDQEQAQLKKSILKYKLKLKRKDTLQPELLSNAYYSLAFSEAVANDNAEALSWLSKAISLDRNYDLYIHLAEDFSLAGKCERKRNNLINARANFVIAHQIFMETNQLDEAKAIKQQLDEISGNE